MSSISDRPLQYCDFSSARICSNNSDCALYTCNTSQQCSNNSASCTTNADCGVASCSRLNTCSNNRQLTCTSVADCGGSPNLCNAPWLCRGGEYGINNVKTRVTALDVKGCTTGLTLGNGTHTVTAQSKIVDNLSRGLVTQGEDGVATVTQTKIVGNGLTSTSGAGAFNDGGVVLTGESAPVLGTSTAAGNNCIYNNTKKGISVQVNSIRTNETSLNVDAQQNYWNGQDSAIENHCTLSPSGGTCSTNAECCPAPLGCTCNQTTERCNNNPSVECNGGDDCSSKCTSVTTGTTLPTPPSACN
jgi:hypothetical protein